METGESRSINKVIKGVLLILILFILMPRKYPLAENHKGLVSTANNTILYSYILTGETYNYIENKIESINKNNTTIDIFKSKRLDSFNIKISGYSITINDKNFGYVATKEEKELIIGAVIEKYIDKIGVDSECLNYVGFEESINIIPDEIEYSKIDNYSDIAQSIYEASIDNEDLLGINITLNVTDEVEFEPITIVKEDKDLYIGDKEVTKGENGIKLVHKEVVYNGDSKLNEEIISEEVIKLSEATIINKGTKNPYYDGVTFLSNPTSGGYVSAPFGEIRNLASHKGVDIANNLGEDVRSALEGKVVYAHYNNGGYGNLIILEHDDNIRTYYAHLNNIFVSEGDIVEDEQVIGSIGSTGRSTGPHLHFELRVDGKPVNPLEYIEK